MSLGLHTVAYMFDCGAIGMIPGLAKGSVVETEHGHVRATVTQAILLLNIGTDVTGIIDGSTRTDLEELLAAAYDAEKRFRLAGA